MKLILAGGARPNFMKIAPLYFALKSNPSFYPVIVHTGQHYDRMMSENIFRQLGLPSPDYHLGVHDGSHAQQTARIMLAFEKVILTENPDWVVVFGDVNSTAACALTAAKMGVPVAHVEAGLRSFDREMPEEINRIVTDSISELFFVTEQSAVDNLLNEGHPAEKIHFVGNLMIDTLADHLREAAKLDTLRKFSVAATDYVLVTMHRPSNVDDLNGLKKIISIIKGVSLRKKVVFVLHPRTRKSIEKHRLLTALKIPNVVLTDPLGYHEFIQLMRHAFVVITDSGGVQDETTYLRVPCFTFRTTTERPVTVELGTNTLFDDLHVDTLLYAFEHLLKGEAIEGVIPPLWDGQSARRIAEIFVTRQQTVAYASL